MARPVKYAEEKNRLDSVRKRLDEAISDTEGMQHSFAGSDDYTLAKIYQDVVQTLREIKAECGETKSKEVGDAIKLE